MALPDRQEFRQVVGLLPTGVTVVTAFTPEGPAGATASAVCSLSLTPMMMLVCLDRSSRTLTAVKGTGRFGINVLGLDQRPAAEVFATKAPLEEKWRSVEWKEQLEVPVIIGCPAHIVCGLHEVIDGGDHVILTGDVIEVEAEPAEPLVFHGGLFRGLGPEGL